MQIVSFATDKGARAGLLFEGGVYLLEGYRDSTELLADWPRVAQSLQAAPAAPMRQAPVRQPRLLSPVTAPRNLYFAGVNYRDHVEEMKDKLKLTLDPNPRASGVKPWHGMKAATSVAGPGDVVARPAGTAMLDWEVELAVVIGITAKDVREEDALRHVAGYTVANDLSARDHVGRPAVVDTSPFKWDWVAQKSFDGACPMGPALTPACAIADPQALAMKLWVNGELRQDSSTRQMIFSVAEQIAWLSSRITLHPGDVILTGTPAGVGAASGRFLKAGDVVRQWIEGIGEFEFSIA